MKTRTFHKACLICDARRPNTLPLLLSFLDSVELGLNCIMHYTADSLENAGLFFANRYPLIMARMRC